MDKMNENVVSARPASGRVFIAIGLVLALLAPILCVVQFSAKMLTTPWYLPALGTAALGVMVLALSHRFSLWRILAVGFAGFLAFVEWAFLLTSALPAYAGPVAVRQPFPAFEIKQADGGPFDQDSLKDGQKTAMVFFRGHW